MTTIKCALDAVRQVLDVAVSRGYLHANPARNASVTNAAKQMFKIDGANGRSVERCACRRLKSSCK
jgi:hypothetical protein